MSKIDMDKGILYILAGVIAVLVLVVGVEIGIDSSTTTGIDLDLRTTAQNAE
jgi:hypothetical protein